MECAYKQQKLDAENRYFPPLYIGKSFFCYRDVNKAIDKHREIYGLRLALKRAVKLENYRIKIENMKDLNLRLKYGELDYHCFVATGRPGRPGNDERCHQLVRLRLSPDARCLIVYESHDHNITPQLEGQINESFIPVKHVAEIGGSLPIHSFCLKGDVTVTPILPEAIQKLMPLMPTSTSSQIKAGLSLIDSPSMIADNSLTKNVNLISSLETVTVTPNNLQPKTQLERNSITITPTSVATPSQHYTADSAADNPEKITLTIKKSECVPNEMVVVGSLRHVEEQKKSVSPSEMLLGKPLQQIQKTSATPVSIVPRPNSTISTSPKITSSVSATSRSSLVSIAINSSGSSRPLVNIAPKLPGINYTKSSIINNSRPLTSIKPNICEREVLPNVKLAASTSVSKVTEIVSHESTIKPVRQILPIKNVSNRPAPVTSNKHGEISESILEKETSPVKLSQKVNFPGGPPKFVANVKLPVPKQLMKAKQVTVLKQSPNMKQVIINKPSPKGTFIGKPAVTKQPHGSINEKLAGIRQGSPILNSTLVKQWVPKPSQNIRSVISSPKPVGANSSPVSTSISTIDAQSNKLTEKVFVAGKCAEKAVLKPKNIIKNKDHPKVILQRHPTSSSPNECQKSVVPNQLPTSKILNGPKKITKKLGRQRPPDSSHFNGRSSSNVVDTELGYNEKQHIAHGVLLTLLKVTSHLPMVEFSDALETFEILTDAFRLNHKVSLSIKHDEEGDMCSLNKYECCNEEIKFEEKDFRVSSTTDDDKLAVTQIDGQCDNVEILKAFTSFQDISPTILKGMPTLEDDVQMEVQEYPHFQIENVVLESASNTNNITKQQTSSKKYAPRTLKRASCEIETSSPCHKRLKQ